jgi:hypothetical protein
MFVAVVLLPLAFVVWMGWWALLAHDIPSRKRRPSLK